MEINNSIPQNSASKAQADQKTAELDTRSTPEQQSTGVEKKNSLLLSDQAKRVQKAQEDMAKQPIVDMDRVQQVKDKLANDGLELFKKGHVSDQAAENIAEKIIQLDALFDEGNLSE